jgi:major intracellular serine protease
MSEFKLLPHEVSMVSANASSEIPVGVTMINAPEYWQHSDKGIGNVVAVLDTGVDLEHPDLKGRIIGGRNFTDSYGYDTGNFQDDHYHGTHVSGTVAANSNGYGVVGVSPETKILVCKVLNKYGSGTLQSVVSGIRYAVDWRGQHGEKVSVISMSLSTSVDFPELHQAVKYAVDSNVLVVCAAGNNGDGDHRTEENVYPASYPEVVSVGAVDADNKIALFSNSNDEIDMVAHGVGVVSTYPGGEYRGLSGTSMSAPHISGAAVLVRNAFKNKFDRFPTEDELYNILIGKCESIGLHKLEEGYGLLDLMKNVEDKPEQPQEPEQPNNPITNPKTYTIYVKNVGDAYIVQLGYYKNRDNAERLESVVMGDLDKVGRASKYSTYVKNYADGYILQMGYYNEHENAKRLANTLADDLLKLDGNKINRIGF